MAKKNTKAKRSRSTTIGSERTVVYRGIKIAPVPGKRSPTAKAIRDALLNRSEQQGGRAAPA